MAMEIRAATEADIPEIQSIYAHHVLTGAGTFEEEPPSVEEIAERFRKVTGRGWAWLVATDETGVLGYAYYTQFRDRSAYRYCCIISTRRAVFSPTRPAASASSPPILAGRPRKAWRR